MINLTIRVHSAILKIDYKINIYKNGYQIQINLHLLYHYSYLFPIVFK